MPFQEGTEDPLALLARRAQEAGKTDQAQMSAILEARAQLEDVYRELRKRPAESPGAGGVQLERPDAAFDLRGRLPPEMRDLADRAFDYERASATRKTEEQEAARQKLLDADVGKWAQLKHSAARIPKNLLGGYGPSVILELGTAPRRMTQGDEQELMERHDRALHAAVRQRAMEANPDWDDARLDQETERQIREERPTIRGGVSGWMMEKILPAAVEFAPQMLPIAAAWRLVSGASRLIPVAAKVAKAIGPTASAVAHSAATGAVYGAARAPNEGELEAAEQGLVDAGSLLERMKRGVKEGAVFGAGSVAGRAVAAIPFPRALKVMGASKEVAERVGATVSRGAAEVGTNVGIVASVEPMEAIKHPIDTIAEASVLALLDPTRALRGAAGLARLPVRLARDLPRAVRERSLEATTEQLAAETNGVPKAPAQSVASPAPTAAQERPVAAEPAPEPPVGMPAPSKLAGAEEGSRARPVWANVDDVGVDAARFQFKGDTGQGGVVPEERLQGKFEHRPARPVLLWEDTAGKRWVVDGHHRIDLAKRTSEPQILADVVREADGVTEAMVRAMGAIGNIRDGTGKVADYARFFRNSSNLGQQQATDAGLLARDKGRAGWVLGRDSSDGLFHAFVTGDVGEDVARAVASSAPGDHAVQDLVVQRLKTGKLNPQAAAGMAAYLSAAAKQAATDKTKATQGGLFGGVAQAERVMKEAEAVGKAVGEINRELSDRINAVQGAARRPDQARALGVDVNNPESVKRKVAALRDERDQWARWTTDPRLVDVARERAGLAPLPGRETLRGERQGGQNVTSLFAAAAPEQAAREQARRAVDPALADEVQEPAKRAARLRHPGASERAAEEVRQALADEVQAKGTTREPQPPDGKWDPASVTALDRMLTRLRRAKDVYRATEGDDSPSRQKLGRQIQETTAEVDRILLAHEGAPLETVLGALEPGDRRWSESPGLKVIADHHPFVGKESGRLQGETDGASLFDEAALVSAQGAGRARAAATRIAEQLGLKEPELVDRFADYGEDLAIRASQVFARKNPDPKRTPKWHQDLGAFVEAEVSKGVNAFAKTFALRAVTRERARVTAKDLEQVADQSGKELGTPEDALADEKAVLALGAQKGGPLEGHPDAVEIAQLWMHERARERAKATGATQRGGQVPGRTLYDIGKSRFVAENGEAAWLALTKAERMQHARERAAPITSGVAKLHEYLRQQAELRGIGVDTSQAGFADPRILFPPAALAKMLWNSAGERRYFKSRAERSKRSTWGATRRAWNYFFETGESAVTTPVWESLLAQSAQRDAETRRAEKRAVDVAEKWRKVTSDETKFFITDALHGFRLTNNGEPLPEVQWRARVQHDLGAMPPDQAAAARETIRDFRLLLREAWSAWQEASGREELTPTTAYFPMARRMEADSPGPLSEFWQDLRAATTEHRAAVDNDHGRMRKEGRPFVENLLHRSPNADLNELDHDPYRVMLNYLGRWHRFVGNKRMERYADVELNGTYRPVALGEGETVRDAFSRFGKQPDSLEPAGVTENDGIKIGHQTFQLTEAIRGDGREFKVSVLGSPGQKKQVRAMGTPGEDGAFVPTLDANGNLKFETRPIHFDARTGEETFGAWSPTEIQIRQGGIRHIKALDGFVHKDVIKSIEDRVARVVGRKNISTLERILSEVMHFQGVVTLGLFNHGIAVGNLSVGTFLNMSELGMKHGGRGYRNLFSDRNRQLTAKAGINLHDASPWSKHDPSASGQQKLKAAYRTAADKSMALMRMTDNLNRGAAYLGGRSRAKEEWDAPGFRDSADMQERIAAWKKRGIQEADFEETYVHQQGLVTAVRVGALMSVVAQPELLNSPWGKVFAQFKRPTIAFANTGMKMVPEALKRRNVAPLVRFLAVGALANWLDDKLGSNMASKVGPRFADLGKDTLEMVGINWSPAEVMPELDDPKSPWSWMGAARVPLPDPYGAGPLWTTVSDFGHLISAMLKGDDLTLAEQYWASRRMTDRLMDSWLPFHKQVQNASDALTPGNLASTVAPSGDPEAPWAAFDQHGRITFRTTQAELARRFAFGTVGSNQIEENLRTWDRVRRQEAVEKSETRAAREQWFDLVEEVRQTGDKAKLQEAQELETKFAFDLPAYRREELLRRLPPWARHIEGYKNDKQFDVIYDRFLRREKLGTTKMQLLDVTDALLKEMDSLSPDRQENLRKMVAELVRD